MKKSKYLSKTVEIDGHIFPSIKEAKRYKQLKLLQDAGEISDLQIQVKYELIPNQYKEVVEYTPKRHQQRVKKKLVERGVTYIADFVYEKDGKTVVEDVKGYMRGQAYALFSIKRKLMLYVHGIEVVEV